MLGIENKIFKKIKKSQHPSRGYPLALREENKLAPFCGHFSVGKVGRVTAVKPKSSTRRICQLLEYGVPEAPVLP